MNILAKNLMILASAGSGKTYQLGNRVIGKIALEGVNPERMVALTFTRKAAGEFADSVLTKLAEGTLDPKKAAEISRDLGSEIEVAPILEQVVAALPRLQLTTMDGFFTKVVRGFQYELGITGGTFDLLQGERKKLAEAEIIDSVLRESFGDNEEFFHAFRRATLGRPGQGVRKTLEEFLKDWLGLWKSLDRDKMGVPVFGDLPSVNDWEAQKMPLIQVLENSENPKALNDLLKAFEGHSIGRSLKLNTIGKRMVEALDQSGPIALKNGKAELEFSAEDWEKWQALFGLAIRCELASSVERTQPLMALVEMIDAQFEAKLRRRGLLGFDDVKNLLGAGMRSEEGRLRRESIDYRLDGRYDHWLLDEFQDTSGSDWSGLATLVDEAVTDPEGGLFVVGDRKQAIYGWRGGDVTIFDDLISNYGGDHENGLQVEPMSKSFRSCPAVLSLVNAVCGDLPQVEKLFGASLRERWVWEDHDSAFPEVKGESKVVTVSKDDGGQAMVEQMRVLGIGEKQLSCGVLVRTSKQVEQFADLLRNEGFDVIEEGQRKPGTDHAVGVTLMNMMRWLADPADQFAREVLEMSPMNTALEKRYPNGWLSRWEGSLIRIQDSGYALFLEELLADEWKELSEYGKRRASDLILALREFDAGGESCPRAARDWVSGLEVAQAPGSAAVQVMTIHKSKGLGFDVVMLPGFPDGQIPSAQHFNIARGEGWLLQAPNAMVRDQVPALKEAFESWSADQIYESMCLLYVALTRSKRGLYLFLDEEPRSRKDKESWRSPANLIRTSAGEDYQDGDANWTADVPARERSEVKASPKLGEAQPLRSRSTPSAAKGEITGGSTGRRIGNEVHALFEKIGWLEAGEIPDQPLSQAGKIVEDALKVSVLHEIFENQGAELFREQQVELILDGKWMSGIVDRMHVYREDGVVTRVEVIDFKTDAVESLELLARYAGQMKAYRRALAQVFEISEEKIDCQLLSTHLGDLVKA